MLAAMLIAIAPCKYNISIPLPVFVLQALALLQRAHNCYTNLPNTAHLQKQNFWQLCVKIFA
jgi:hypothetical protein